MSMAMRQHCPWPLSKGIPEMAGLGRSLSGGLGPWYGWVVPRAADIRRSLNIGNARGEQCLGGSPAAHG
jgi:hypothetical protein